MNSAYEHIFSKGKLTTELIEQARVELQETEEKRTSCLSELRQLLSESKNTDEGKDIYNMFNQKDNDYLMRFLRARKFDVKKAYTLMKGHVKFHKNYPQLTSKLTLDSVRSCLENGYPCLLPVRDKQGRVTFLFSIEGWDMSDYPFHVIMRAYLYLLERLMISEETQITGCVLIENFHNYSLKQALGLRPSELRMFVDILQGSFPARFKGVHFVHQPWYFSWTYAMVKPFLKRKLTKKVFIHGYELENFWENFDMNSIPKELGGDGDSYDPQLLIKALEKLEKQEKS